MRHRRGIEHVLSPRSDGLLPFALTEVPATGIELQMEVVERCAGVSSDVDLIALWSNRRQLGEHLHRVQDCCDRGVCFGVSRSNCDRVV